MDNKPKSTAKDFFLCLGIFTSLYISAVSFLILIFSIINEIFPLTNEYLGQNYSSIRGAIAALVIFFPVFLYIFNITNKDLILNPEKKDYWVRKWMIFFTLFVTGLTVATDLVTLIYRFLGAEDLSLRFFLKVFFVLLVAISVFRSSLSDLRRTTFNHTRGSKISAAVVSLILLSSVVCGIVVIGSPSEQRARAMDEQRISDLMSIQNEIVYTWWENKGDIPEILDNLTNPINGFVVPKDPVTGENYEYIRVSKNTFQLCAILETENLNTDAKISQYPYPVKNGVNENWQHDVGRNCFERTIDETINRAKEAK